MVLLTKLILQCSNSTKLRAAPLIRCTCFGAIATGHGWGSAATTSMHLVMRAPQRFNCARSITFRYFFNGLCLLNAPKARTMRKRKFLLTTSQKPSFLKKKAAFFYGGGARLARLYVF